MTFSNSWLSHGGDPSSVPLPGLAPSPPATPRGRGSLSPRRLLLVPAKPAPKDLSIVPTDRVLRLWPKQPLGAFPSDAMNLLHTFLHN